MKVNPTKKVLARKGVGNLCRKVQRPGTGGHADNPYKGIQLSAFDISATDESIYRHHTVTLAILRHQLRFVSQQLLTEASVVQR